MRKRRLLFGEAAVVLLCPIFAAAALAQEASPTPAADAEYRKAEQLFSILRKRNAEQFAIRSEKGIQEASFVTIGGIEQWVTIRGWDRANPVLLFLHGGPGEPTNTWSFVTLRSWEKQFTVVQWDQRGAGRTLRKNGAAIGETIKLSRLTEDGIELANYLRKHLAKEKIIIVGHSFGSLLGLQMARAKPELFAAYVGTGQVADNSRSYSVAYEELLKKARAVGNQEAIDELTRVGPPPYKSGEGFGVQRKWSNAFEGADQFLFGTIGLTLVAPGNTAQDLNDTVEGEMLSADHLVPETKGIGPDQLGREFSVPMFCVQGAEDFTTPTSLARTYFDSIKAPRKEFVTIPGGGHFAVFMKSNEFLKELVAKVRPIAIRPN